VAVCCAGRRGARVLSGSRAPPPVNWVTLGRGLRPSPTEGARRVYVEQHGCATTQGEASMMRGILAQRGHQLVPTLEEAEAAVLVTCTVVETTERTMLKRIREIAGTGKDLVVSGCMASSQVDAIKAASSRALVLPPQYLHQVGELIEREPVEFCYQPKTGLPKVREGVVDTVVINEGCSGKCTFCITKIARPGLRSYPVEGVVEDVRRAVAAGAVEVRLTSQDSGAYGLDRGTDLPTLLRHACEVPGDYGLRVGMLNPFILDKLLPDLLEAFAHPRVFKFLHLPVQSGSDRVLQEMGRHHTAADVQRQVAAFRARFPDLLLSTDVIVGFPGETEEDHQATVRLLERLEPEIVNVTRFSRREGTPAALRRDQVPSRIAKERSRELTRLRFDLCARRLSRFVGRETEVLTTEPGKGGTVLARTGEYAPVILPAGAPLGKRFRVRITGAGAVFLQGARPP